MNFNQSNDRGLSFNSITHLSSYNGDQFQSIAAATLLNNTANRNPIYNIGEKTTYW